MLVGGRGVLSRVQDIYVFPGSYQDDKGRHFVSAVQQFETSSPAYFWWIVGLRLTVFLTISTTLQWQYDSQDLVVPMIKKTMNH